MILKEKLRNYDDQIKVEITVHGFHIVREEFGYKRKPQTINKL